MPEMMLDLEKKTVKNIQKNVKIFTIGMKKMISRHAIISPN